MTSTTTTSHGEARAGRRVAKGGPFAWRAVDIITLAVLGVALGVVFWGWDTFLYNGFSALFTAFPPAGELALGVWLLPAVAGAMLVRRPGAALLCELIAANVEFLLGNQWAAGVLLSGVLQGLGVEIAVALWRWRRHTLPVAVLGGALAAVLEIVFYEWHAYVAEYSWAWKVVYLGCGVLSGALFAGIVGRLLVRSLATAGAVNNFPPGEEHILAAGRTA